MRQKLGQHFLKNKKILGKIADSLDLKKGDVVVEIGPGHGELTQYLVNAGVTIIAIERDNDLANYLCSKFQILSTKSQTNSKFKIQNSKINVIEGDALKILSSLHANYQIPNTNYKLVGNIPYYITGYLLRIISELKNKPSLTALLIQKEVAERIVAKPPRMNLLAASVQFWAEPEILFDVVKGNFSPPPKVDSSVVLLKTKNENIITLPLNDRRTVELEEEINYYRFIRTLFKQPRKTALNNLVSGGYKKEGILKFFEKRRIKENSRPQDFGVDMLINMALEL